MKRKLKTWLFNKPVCNCYSSYTNDKGKIIHYADCAIIQQKLQR